MQSRRRIVAGNPRGGVRGPSFAELALPLFGELRNLGVRGRDEGECPPSTPTIRIGAVSDWGVIHRGREGRNEAGGGIGEEAAPTDVRRAIRRRVSTEKARRRAGRAAGPARGAPRRRRRRRRRDRPAGPRDAPPAPGRRGGGAAGRPLPHPVGAARSRRAACTRPRGLRGAMGAIPRGDRRRAAEHRGPAAGSRVARCRPGSPPGVGAPIPRGGPAFPVDQAIVSGSKVSVMTKSSMRPSKPSPRFEPSTRPEDVPRAVEPDAWPSAASAPSTRIWMTSRSSS